MKRIVRQYALTVGAIAGLVVLALAVSGYILANQRLRFPWDDTYELKARFKTGQALTPGQGQNVTVAGVTVGEIAKVELEDGVALVTFAMDRKKLPRVDRDARMLLRPKTGLQDMSAELDPGTPAAGSLPDGGEIPLAQTKPNVNPDEVLAGLDADTRTYLQAAVNEGARGLRDRGAALRRILRATQPTLHDTRAVAQALADRRGALKRLTHNLRLLTEAAASKDDDLRRLVRASAATLGTLAEREDDIRSSLDRLPGTLRAAQGALAAAQGLARELPGAAGDLRPAVRALPPALDAADPLLAEMTPALKNDVRPFVRSARPLVRDLRPAVADLNAQTPALSRAFDVLNYVVNELAYNPDGPEEGYLFWTAWFFHNAASILGSSDAQGTAWRGQIMISCSSLQSISQLAPVLEPLFAAAAPVCPDPIAKPARR